VITVDNILQTKLVELPRSLSVQDKIKFLNAFLNDMQSDGMNILSTKESLEGHFIIEYRGANLGRMEQ